jgi:protein TonB
METKRGIPAAPVRTNTHDGHLEHRVLLATSGGLCMNYALSQPRSDRHPVGLMVVVGLHVVLAAALLSAKLKTGPTEIQAIPMIPIDPVKPIVQKTPDLPKPAEHPVQHVVAVMPPIVVDHTDAIVADKPSDKPIERTEPTIVIASAGPLRETQHFVVRNGSLNAGAIQCRPDYPAAAQRLGVMGTTRIRFSVDAVGRILGAQILQSSGPSRENRMLDQAAATALAKCPVTLGSDDQGHAVPFTTDVDYVWALN